MKPFIQTINWEGTNPLKEVVIQKKEDHWESIEAHFKNEHQQESLRVRQEAETNIRKQLEKEHQEKALQVHSIIQSFQEAIPAAFQEMEQALSHMACTLTRKLIADVPVDAERMHAVISQALKELENDSDVSIMIHPDDLDLITNESGQDPSEAFTQEGNLKFEPVSHLTRGGCYIKTPFGDFDATMETKWERIESLFHKQTEDSGLFKKHTTERKAS